jgi:hypothetical protein
MGWSMGIPLSDDLWLGMQLRNVAMVDQIFMRFPDLVVSAL